MIPAKNPAAWAMFLLLMLGATVPHAAQSPLPPPRRPVTLDDLNAIKQPGEPRLSPDGAQVAYEADGRIVVTPSRGGKPRAITSTGSSASDPYWSRDGRYLYFLSDRVAGKSQLWRLSLAAFGEAEQLTQLPRGVASLNLSPDESRLLLNFRGPPEKGDEPAGTNRSSPWVITRRDFKEDARDGYITTDHARHLYILDLNSGVLRQVTGGIYSESQPAWSADGRSVVFVSNREADPDASYKTDLWLVSADAGPDQAPRRLTHDEAVKSSPVFSPDGRWIAYLSAEDGVYGVPQVALIAPDGTAARVLTKKLDRWVNDLHFSADGRWIYFSYEQLGGVDIGRVRVADGALETVLAGERQVSAFDVAGNGVLAARVELMNDAPEIHVFEKGTARRLSDLNGGFLRSVALGSKEKLEFSSPDGTRIEAFLTKPPGFVPGRRYPTILSLHGGPVGQFTYGYDIANQYLAAQGYVIVEPNPRGSTGRGQDFVRAIYQSWGVTDYEDVIAAIDHVIDLGIADPERLAVTGYSYGGYMTNVVITRTDRFKAAASGAGHSLIIANYGHDIYQKWYNWELGVPWENTDKYDRLSPLRQVGKVRTPTLFFGGRDDWNVPVINAELFYQSLKVRGVDTQLVVYPGTHHGGWSDEFERDRLSRMHAWFDAHLH